MYTNSSSNWIEKEIFNLNKMSLKSILMLSFLILLWGVSWPVYKIAVPYTPPLLFAGMRAFLGGILLTMFIWKTYDKIKWRNNWHKYFISTFFNSIVFVGLQTIGLNYLPSGLFSVIVYVQPILLGVFAWLLLHERLTGMKIVGLCIGFIGIIVASADGLTTHMSAIGVILALLTGIGWAYGVIYVKKVSNEISAYWMVAIQNILGGAVLLSAGTVLESWTEIVWNGSYMFGLVFGMTVGIPLAYVIYYTLVNNGEASKVGSATFCVPILSVLIGVIFLGESLTYKLLIGMSLVGISIYLVNLKPKQVTKSKRSQKAL